jgi:hypothetical protein
VITGGSVCGAELGKAVDGEITGCVVDAVPGAVDVEVDVFAAGVVAGFVPVGAGTVMGCVLGGRYLPEV